MKKRNVPHDSAVTHVAGGSVFIDDRPFQSGELLVGMVYSTVPSGVLNGIDYSQALLVEGIHGVFTHKDLSTNIWGPIIHDQPMLVERDIRFYGEVIAVIAGETQAAIDEAKEKIILDITETKPIFSIWSGD